LIRAAEPVRGFGPSTSAGAERQGRGNGRLSGPGKLCAGLGITRQHNGLDLTRGPIVIADAAALDDVLDGLGDGAGVGDGQSRAPGRRGERMKRSARIGVEYAGAWARRRLRFYLAGNAHVSGQPRD
jgi:DNA-3-methyladenine glycosylase